jgi:hypothetical protein
VAPAEEVEVGQQLSTQFRGDRTVAIFERNGRTCVLAGHVMRVSTLVKLAAWKGGGEVRS